MYRNSHLHSSIYQSQHSSTNNIHSEESTDPVNPVAPNLDIILWYHILWYHNLDIILWYHIIVTLACNIYHSLTINIKNYSRNLSFYHFILARGQKVKKRWANYKFNLYAKKLKIFQNLFRAWGYLSLWIIIPLYSPEFISCFRICHI